MNYIKKSIQLVLLAVVATSIAACGDKEVVIVHHRPAHHHTGTTPAEYGVVNSYEHR